MNTWELGFGSRIAQERIGSDRPGLIDQRIKREKGIHIVIRESLDTTTSQPSNLRRHAVARSCQTPALLHFGTSAGFDLNSTDFGFG